MNIKKKKECITRPTAALGKNMLILASKCNRKLKRFTRNALYYRYFFQKNKGGSEASHFAPPNNFPIEGFTSQSPSSQFVFRRRKYSKKDSCPGENEKHGENKDERGAAVRVRVTKHTRGLNAAPESVSRSAFELNYLIFIYSPNRFNSTDS